MKTDRGATNVLVLAGNGHYRYGRSNKRRGALAAPLSLGVYCFLWNKYEQNRKIFTHLSL